MLMRIRAGTVEGNSNDEWKEKDITDSEADRLAGYAARICI